MIDWLLSGGWVLMCCICGPVMMFQTPQKRTGSKTKGKRKKPSADPKQRRKDRRVLSAKTKAKQKNPLAWREQYTQTWAKLPDYNASQIANIEMMFRVGRGETVPDSWG